MTTTMLHVTDMTEASFGVNELGGAAQWSLQDLSVSSYVEFAMPGYAHFPMQTFTLGTGRAKSAYLALHALSSAAGTLTLRLDVGVPEWVPVGGVGVATAAGEWFVTAPAALAPLTQAQIDAMIVRIDWSSPSGAALRLHELQLFVVHATAPTAAVTYPTAGVVVGTSSPTVTWSHTAGSDGGPQTHYEIKAFDEDQYTAGGFSADTSAFDWWSGQPAGSETSRTIGPLDNFRNYRVYVRTAQTINSVPHWSPWVYGAFSTNFSPANPTSVVATPVHAGGYLSVATAITASPSWVSMEVERSDDGADWVPVRGATNVTETNAHVVTFSTTSVVVRDHEAPEGVDVIYRSRATRTTGVVGAWVESTATRWTAPVDRTAWLKDPHDPTLNVVVDVQEFPQPTTDVDQGIYRVVNARFPTVITDVRTASAGTFVMQTATIAQARALQAAVAGSNQFKLLQFTNGHLWGSKYVALGTLQALNFSAYVDTDEKAWQVSFVEIDRPADETEY